MPYLLEMKNITKTFGSVKAIDNVCGDAANLLI